MASLTIRPLRKGEKVLPRNIIWIWCKKHKGGAHHKRVVKDEFTGQFRKPLRLATPRTGFNGNLGYWKCQVCGAINRF